MVTCRSVRGLASRAAKSSSISRSTRPVTFSLHCSRIHQRDPQGGVDPVEVLVRASRAAQRRPAAASAPAGIGGAARGGDRAARSLLRSSRRRRRLPAGWRRAPAPTASDRGGPPSDPEEAAARGHAPRRRSRPACGLPLREPSDQPAQQRRSPVRRPAAGRGRRWRSLRPGPARPPGPRPEDGDDGDPGETAPPFQHSGQGRQDRDRPGPCRPAGPPCPRCRRARWPSP